MNPNIQPVSTGMAVPTFVSIGIIAWNEEEAIRPALNSLFQQSLFARLSAGGRRCEIVCLANGCTDRTPQVAAGIFSQQAKEHPHAAAFSCRVLEIAERGKINAWNVFVHSASARDAQFLFLMDADIVIHRRETLWNMLATLENCREASVSVDRPCKHLEFTAAKTLRERFSLAASRLSRSSAGLCGQLYCIRSEIARNIYLPKDLSACDDGFIKALVCTDFLAHPVWPVRIQLAPEAAHTFEAYTSLSGILRNQKRQMIGQTIVHLLVDKYLKTLHPLSRSALGETLRENERWDPDWLKRLISDHVRRTRFFWRLYPGLLTAPFARLANVRGLKKILCVPAALAGFAAALISSFAAARFFRAGYTSYWPRAERRGFDHSGLEPQPSPQFTRKPA